MKIFNFETAKRVARRMRARRRRREGLSRAHKQCQALAARYLHNSNSERDENSSGGKIVRGST